jgi:hypothetical protein
MSKGFVSQRNAPAFDQDFDTRPAVRFADSTLQPPPSVIPGARTATAVKVADMDGEARSAPTKYSCNLVALDLKTAAISTS